MNNPIHIMFIDINEPERQVLKTVLHSELRSALDLEHGECLHEIYKQISNGNEHPVWSSRREALIKREAQQKESLGP
jgi:hypothetical protein